MRPEKLFTDLQRLTTTKSSDIPLISALFLFTLTLTFFTTRSPPSTCRQTNFCQDFSLFMEGPYSDSLGQSPVPPNSTKTNEPKPPASPQTKNPTGTRPKPINPDQLEVPNLNLNLNPRNPQECAFMRILPPTLLPAVIRARTYCGRAGTFPLHERRAELLWRGLSGGVMVAQGPLEAFVIPQMRISLPTR